MKKQSKFLKSSLFIFAFFFITETSFAQQTFTYTGNSNYLNPAGWTNGQVPQTNPDDTIIIEGNCQLNDPSMIEDCKIIVRSGGVFKVPEVPVPSVLVESGGVLDVEQIQMNSNLNIQGTLKAKRFKMNLSSGGNVEIGY